MSVPQSAFPMSRDAKEHYLNTTGYDVCPYCENDIDTSVEYGDMEPVETGAVEQRATCLKCNRQWLDVFTLTDVRELGRISTNSKRRKKPDKLEV